MRTPMECRDVRELADSFVAGELAAETDDEIRRHLESCPACRAEIGADRAVRESLRAAVARAPQLEPRPEFVSELRATLRQQAIAAAPPARPATVPRWWAVAAGIIVAATAGLLVYRSGSTAASTLARMAVGDHRFCALKFELAERPISLPEAARRFGAPYGLLEAVPAADISTAAGAAHVVERHSCVYQGRRFAHIVLQYNGRLVSLLVTAAAPGEQRQAAAPERIDAMNLLAFRAGRYELFVAGDVPDAALEALADAVADPLGRELAGA